MSELRKSKFVEKKEGFLTVSVSRHRRGLWRMGRFAIQKV